MRIGLFIGDATGTRTSVEDLVASARSAEAAGFSTGWVPHIPWSLDGLTALALAGQVTERIELGTAVMPTYTRHPLAMAQQALSAQAASGGRVALGIGPSHPVVIERMFGLEYDRPAAHTREYVEVLRRAVAASVEQGKPEGEFVAFEGEFFRVSSMLVVPGADAPMPILIAALAPLMLRVAGEVTDGTITYWANERAIGEHVVPRITRAADDAGRPSPRVVVGIPVAVVRDPAAARERARPRSSPPTKRSRPTSAFSGAAATSRRPTSRSSAPRTRCWRASVRSRPPARPTCARRRWDSTTTARSRPAGPSRCSRRRPAGVDVPSRWPWPSAARTRRR